MRDSDLVLAVEEELKFRDDNQCHFYQDKVAVKGGDARHR